MTEYITMFCAIYTAILVTNIFVSSRERTK